MDKTRLEVWRRTTLEPDIPESVAEALRPCMFRKARPESRICQGDVEYWQAAVEAWMAERDVGIKLAMGLAYACYWMEFRKRQQK